MTEFISETGKWIVVAAPLFLLSFALAPSALLKQNPQATARAGSLLALGSFMAALLSFIPLLLNGPIVHTFWQSGFFKVSLYYDNLSAVLLLLVSLLGAVILRYSENYLEGDQEQGRFTRWLCLTAGSVLALVITGNLLLFALAWASVSLCLHQLLIFYPDRPGALLAARKKVIFSRLGDLCLFAAMILIYREFHTLDFQELFQQARVVAAAAEGREGFGLIGFFLVSCALLKSAQFPFHSWLPDTMETPTPVSALMHAGIINAGGFLIVRLSPVVILSPESLQLLAIAGGFTALFASLTMLTHASVKRALAFSTVAQMGFMMLQCGLGAFGLAVLHLVAHSLYKAHAFLSSGSILQVSRSAWVPDTQPKAHPLILLATVLSGALITYSGSWILGISLFKSPGSLFLGLVFCFSLSYMLWNLWSHSPRPSTIFAGLALASALVLTGFSLHLLFDSILAASLPAAAANWNWTETLLVSIPFILFLAVLIFQTQLPAWSSHPVCRAFYVHSRNGFYFTTLANRLVAACWPLKSDRFPKN